MVKFVILPMAVAKLLWSVVMFFTDTGESKGVVKNRNNYGYHYSLNLANKIISNGVEEIVTRVEEDDGQKLDNIKLKGTYLGGDASFIVIEDGVESKFIYIGEKFRGYELIKVGERKVVFERNGKNYYVLLSDDEDEKKGVGKRAMHKKPSNKREPQDSGGVVTITRDELNSYIKNPNKIWNNIRIQERRREGMLDGFRVNYVKRGSFFDKAGLKSGDIIKRIDGNEIESLADVMKYYTSVDSLESLTLTVLRGGEEVEIDFSVN
jgi:general secretion pathway protein C